MRARKTSSSAPLAILPDAGTLRTSVAAGTHGAPRAGLTRLGAFCVQRSNNHRVCFAGANICCATPGLSIDANSMCHEIRIILYEQPGGGLVLLRGLGENACLYRTSVGMTNVDEFLASHDELQRMLRRALRDLRRSPNTSAGLHAEVRATLAHARAVSALYAAPANVARRGAWLVTREGRMASVGSQATPAAPSD